MPQHNNETSGDNHIMNGEQIIKQTEQLRWELPQGVRDRWVEDVYAESARIATRNVDQRGASRRLSWERRLDWFHTNRWTGFPTMVLLLAAVLWITIEGANLPSGWLATLFLDMGHPFLKDLAQSGGIRPHRRGTDSRRDLLPRILQPLEHQLPGEVDVSALLEHHGDDR